MGFYYQLFPCTRALIKELLGTNALEKENNAFWDVIVNLLSVTALMLLLISIVPWMILNTFIRVFLKSRHGENYGGLLDMDTLLEHYNPKLLINIVYIVEHDGTPEELYGDIKEACKRLHRSHFKFSSVVKRFLGYYYYLKNQVPLDEVVTMVKFEGDHLTKEILVHFLEKYYFELAKGDKKLWDVKVFDKEITWNGHTKCYPVVIRTNHCVGDAVYLSVFHQKYLMSEVIDDQFVNAMKKSQKTGENLNGGNALRSAYIGERLNYSDLESKENDRQKIAFYTEKDARYFGIIRKLRTHFNLTFTDIFLTTAAASTTDYIKGKGVSRESFVYGVTARSSSEDPMEVLKGKALKNNLTVILAEFPVNCPSDNLSSVVKSSEGILRYMRTSANKQINYIVYKLLALLPPKVLTAIVDKCSRGSTLGITNIPGPNFGKIEGHAIKDVIGFVTSVFNIKFMITILTYDGKLQVLLSSNKGMTTTRNELQSILENTFNNIDKLWEENKECIERKVD